MDARKQPLFREDDNELLGFVENGKGGWEAQTIFGYSIARVGDKMAAEAIVREQGLSFLNGVWQYFDEDDQAWHPCVLKEAYEHQVTVVRTNAMGYQDPDDYKTVVINNPSEINLIKA